MSPFNSHPRGKFHDLVILNPVKNVRSLFSGLQQGRRTRMWWTEKVICSLSLVILFIHSGTGSYSQGSYGYGYGEPQQGQKQYGEPQQHGQKQYGQQQYGYGQNQYVSEEEQNATALWPTKMTFHETKTNYSKCSVHTLWLIISTLPVFFSAWRSST